MRDLGMLIALLTASQAVFADVAPRCANNVAALDTEFQAATAKKDVAAIDRLLPDDYILMSSKGEPETKAGLLAEARDLGTVYTRQDDSQQTVHIWGNTAVLTALLTAIGTQNGKPFEYHVWFSDVYVCTAQGWRYVFAQVGGHAS